MKRKIAVLLVVLMMLMLSACTANPKGVEHLAIFVNGEPVTAIYDYDEQTITVNGEVYHYEYNDGDITITYPNGSYWWESVGAHGSVGGWNGDYDMERYIDGSALAQQLTQAYQYSRKNWDQVLVVGFVSLIIIVVSILDIKHPDILHRMRYGLWVQNAEPTEFALTISRVCGVVAIVLAVIMFLVVLFS